MSRVVARPGQHVEQNATTETDMTCHPRKRDGYDMSMDFRNRSFVKVKKWTTHQLLPCAQKRGLLPRPMARHRLKVEPLAPCLSHGDSPSQMSIPCGVFNLHNPDIPINHCLTHKWWNVQNLSLIPLNPAWFFSGSLSWIRIIPNVSGSI